MFDATSSLLATPLQQSVEYRNALTDSEAHVSSLQDGTLVLQRQVAGLSLAMLPRARVTQETLVGQIKTAGLQSKLLVIAPNHPAPWLANLGAVATMTPSYVAEVSLLGDLRGQLHQKWRNRLSFAERQGLRITRQNLPIKPDNWILKRDKKQQDQRRYKSWSQALTLAYAKANRGSAKLFTAFEGKAQVAAMLFLRHGGCATYHIGHSTPDGRALCAHNLLLWEGMNWLASKGVTQLELGQIDTQQNAGLARFKLGAGATLRPLGGTWLWWPPLGKTLTPLKFLDRRLMAGL